jgi:hypothetical protein
MLTVLLSQNANELDRINRIIKIKEDKMAQGSLMLLLFILPIL